MNQITLWNAHADVLIFCAPALGQQRARHDAEKLDCFRELNGLGTETSPQPGSVADLIVLEGNPLDDTAHLRKPGFDTGGWKS